MDTLESLIKDFDAGISERANWIERWDECYKLAMPGRTRFYDTAPGQSLTDEIFDSTAVESTAEFASRMQAGMTPPFARWFSLVAGSEIEEREKQRVNEELDLVSDYVWESMNQSNLNQELHECYIDLAVGTAVLGVEEGDIINPLRFTAIPQQQVVLRNGPYGNPDKVYRHRELTYEQMRVIWPNGKFSNDIKGKGERDREYKFFVIECVKRDWEEIGTETYNFMVVIKDPASVVLEGRFVGEGSNPLLPFRWSKQSGETYGRGPLLNCMGDVRALNALVELGLENLAMSITGMWQADDDGIINPETIQLIPGTIIPRSPASRGLEPLQSPSNFDAAQFSLKEYRHNVRKALFNETLGTPEGTPMSAREVHERMADLARTVGSAYGRLNTELVTPLIRRVIHILKRRGDLELPMVNGKEIKVQNISPLAQAQHNEDVARVARFLQLLNGGFGPQVTNVVVKAEEAAIYTAEKIGVPEKLMRDEAERAQLQAAIAETQQISSEQANASDLQE